jgi:hypothetical protein
MNAAKNTTTGMRKIIRIYTSKLYAVRSFIPQGLHSVEIGMGMGRFAGPIDTCIVVEPSANMAQFAQNHGIEMIIRATEYLSLCDHTFDFVPMVSAICFF